MSTTSTDTYDQVGIREDLINNIWNVDPQQTPFISSIAKSSAKNTYHEWQTDTYASAADNIAVEGADASFTPAASTIRMGNYTQILQKTAMVSGTLEATDRAGRDREMNYQMMKRGVELKRDLERACVGVNNAQVAGNATTGREMGSFTSYVYTNDSVGGGGASPTGQGATSGTTARTDGTQRAFTEGLLEGVIDSIFNSSGEMADRILLGSFNKRAMNGFTGRATTTDHRVTEGSIVSAADIYKSDYGDLEIVAGVFNRARDGIVYKKDKWALGVLRPMKSNDIASTGDAEKKQIIMEATLVSRNEKSSGLVADLTTS